MPLQLSLLAVTIFVGNNVPLPAASRLRTKVVPIQLTVGAILSTTVTCALHVAVLDAASVAVNVTLFTPVLVQSKLSISKLKLGTPPLSLEPLSICAGVMVTLPVLSNDTLISWHTAIGFTPSVMVTTAIQLLVLPLASATVTCTLFGPRLALVNAKGVAVVLVIPHASDDDCMTSFATMLAFPVLSNATLIF